MQTHTFKSLLVKRLVIVTEFQVPCPLSFPIFFKSSLHFVFMPKRAVLSFPFAITVSFIFWPAAEKTELTPRNLLMIFAVRLHNIGIILKI